MYELRCLRIWKAWAVLICLPTSAIAESHFVISESSPVASRAHIDFTIIIPEFVHLATDAHPIKNSAGLSPITPPEKASPSSLHVVGNGGTIVLEPSSDWAVSEKLPIQRPPAVLESASAPFTVAMP